MPVVTMPPKHAVPYKRDDEGRAEEPQRRTRDFPSDESHPPSEWGPRTAESPAPHTAPARAVGRPLLDPEPSQPKRFVVVESQPLPPHPPSPLDLSHFPATVESAGADNVPHLRFPNLIFKRKDAPPLPDSKDSYITPSKWESIPFPGATTIRST